MRIAVIYNSKTGFTLKYATWLTEGLRNDNHEVDCLEFEEAKKKDFGDYDAIAFGGWLCAEKVSKSQWFKERIPQWKDKKLVLFGVGGSPNENPEVARFLEQVLTEDEKKYCKAFYCQGGMNYERMSTGNKIAMKMFIKMLRSRKNQTENDKLMIDMISHSYDVSDPKFLEPIIQYINE